MGQIKNKPDVIPATAKPTEVAVRKPFERPRYYSPELFGSANELVIEHAGEEYRLRITSKGKLILTK
ncbi:MAG: hemin uptake protein HemP [Methylophilaceae bacterium]|nr:hemin uptake protein HemP [Methylophilaceae bacterium]